MSRTFKVRIENGFISIEDFQQFQDGGIVDNIEDITPQQAIELGKELMITGAGMLSIKKINRDVK
jgi:hypothetical protein